MQKIRLFLYTAAIILALTGLAKIVSGTSHVRLLAEKDPIIGLAFRYIMLVAGGLEVGAALICVMPKLEKAALLTVAWLASSFLMYRLGLMWVDWKSPCHCLGNFTDALHLSPVLADNLMKIVLGYLLLGSYASLIWLWKKDGKSATTVPPAAAAGSAA